MKITYLGHAGFCVETSRAVVFADPWLSPTGAFDAAWFQFPRNHHLAAFVQEKMADPHREQFLYISHEHKDHFDLPFLNSLGPRDFTLVLPRFRREELRAALADYSCKGTLLVGDGEEVDIPGGTLTLYLDDSELNRDSAMLVKADGQSFLDLNDCRIFDALPAIVRQHGQIDVFTCQFSGAGWHPTCYEYSTDRYELISRKKVMSKFRTVEQAIKTVQPRLFLPSAGPPAFLDPMLFHLNFERVNIFPRAPQLIAYLDRRLKDSTISWPQIMPGDVLDVASGTFVYRAPDRVDEENLPAYLRSYASSYEVFFRERQTRYRQEDLEKLLKRLKEELEYRLELLTLRDRVHIPLYFRLQDVPDRMLRVDFPAGTVEHASELPDRDFYSISAASWEVGRLLDRQITWDDFTLTFRMRLSREPDVYHTVLHGFLHVEPEDLDWFCAKLLNIEKGQERIIVEAEGRRYVTDRYCPHQGGDLRHGWVEEGRLLTCPRHGWQFDLERTGQSLTSAGTINAVSLDDD